MGAAADSGELLMASIANLIRGTGRELFERFLPAGTDVVRVAEPRGRVPDSQALAQGILVASDRCRHAQPTVMPLGRRALSAQPSATDIAPDRDGAGLRLAGNPRSPRVDMRWSFRKGRSRRATAGRPPASGGLGKSFHPVEVMTRAERTLSIQDHPVRCGQEVTRC